MSDKNHIMQEIESVVVEVQELLKKSGMALHKDGEEEMTPPAADAGAAPEAPAPEAPAPDAIGEQAAEAPAEGAPAPEEGLEDAAQEPGGDLASEAKGLSDEELDNLLQVLMAEKETRKAPAQAEAPMAPPAGGDEMPAAEKSMKEEYAKLGKSLDTVMGAVEALSKKVDSLSAKPAPQAQPKVTAKAPAANSQDIQVLHKSAPVMKRLSKSDTVEFLENQLRKGNKSVNRDVMHDCVLTKTEEELHAFQDGLAKKGIELPKL